VNGNIVETFMTSRRLSYSASLKPSTTVSC